MIIGQRLKEARLAAGLSQRQLCGDTITRNMLSQIENGTARPSMDTLKTFAQRLGKPLSYFLEEGESPSQTALANAHICFRNNDIEGALKALEGCKNYESAQDDSVYFLKALACLRLAEVAIAQERLPYAISLLEECKLAGEQTLYYTPELERSRLILLAKAKRDTAEQILSALPPMDEELLLRAQVAMEKDVRLAASLLDTAQDRTGSRWNLLRGQVAFAQADYRVAAEYFHKAEDGGERSSYHWLEQCYQRLEDYKMAYHYACKQK